MDLARRFLSPGNSVHRQYEALRAYFVDRLPGAEAARRFGYTIGSFRQLVHDFRGEPDRCFFRESRRETTRTEDPVRLRIIELRKQYLSVYDIADALRKEGAPRSPVLVSQVVAEAGFAKLPRRRDDDRPPAIRPDAAATADVRALSLEPRALRTKFGGLFLFLPALVAAGFDAVIEAARLPGTKVIPAPHAIRSLLALKLFRKERHTHVMSAVMDEGLALFAGLNTIPKRSFLTEYSCRLHPDSQRRLMSGWFDAATKLGLRRGASFDLDFHTIPFHGEDALLEKHYVSKRSRKQRGILAFLAQDADGRYFCYANCDVRKERQADEILRFVEYWRKRTGKPPGELIFDSQLTTHGNLSKLNQMGVEFITLRRRQGEHMRELRALEDGAWRRVELEGVSRKHKTPRYIEQRIRLKDYEGELRQIAITDLGHDEPTLLLTNQLRRSPKRLIERYARRMLIENNIEDGIDFFHMDSLSSVALKVDCDLQLTLIGSSLYRHLGQTIGNGYESAKSRRIFQDFIDATATVTIGERTIEVRFQKRAHNPLLLAAGFDKLSPKIPWLGGRRLTLTFG
jgi:hypothetical protein